jgi:putative membrane protein
VLLWLVGSIVPGFHVESFGTAFFGALIISIVSWTLSSFFRSTDGRYHVITHHQQISGRGEKRVEGTVIK